MPASLGFAIRCPFCGNWSIWRGLDPRSLAVRSPDEAKQILLTQYQRGTEAGKHPKLLRCTSPRWICPSSYEALIFEDESTALSALKDICKARTLSRDFRLFREDCETRWEDPPLYGILTCMQPVPRQEDVELGSLLDPELLHRMSLGISAEIQTPCTFYAPRHFKTKFTPSMTFWMPTEPYFRGTESNPQGYNRFCEQVRNVVLSDLAERCEKEKYSTSNCPLALGENGLCAGQQAACTQNPIDWHHCPAFLTQRGIQCPCYLSDVSLINRVSDEWTRKGRTDESIQYRDTLGFSEVCFPIAVQGHLIGVAITGQMYRDPDEIISVEELVSRWPALRDYRECLEQAKASLIQEEIRLKKRDSSRFLVDSKQFEQRKKMLGSFIQRVSHLLNTRNSEIQGRTEYAFREEILALIRNAKAREDFFQSIPAVLLERMREFWGFEAAYIARHSPVTNNISVLAFSSAFVKTPCGFPGDKLCRVDLRYAQPNPTLYIHSNIDKAPPTNPFLKALVSRHHQLTHDGRFNFPSNALWIFTIVPVVSETFIFLFAVQSGSAGKVEHVSFPDDVCDLLREAIFRTCSESVYAFPHSPPEQPLAFISHDSRDNNRIARPLADKLIEMRCPVWYDEYSLQVGDPLRQSIEDGIRKCRTCILVVSPNFLTNKGWTAKEFNAVFTREILEKEDLVLPIWCNVTPQDVFEYSPTLADRLALDWSLGIDEVAYRLKQAIIRKLDRH